MLVDAVFNTNICIYMYIYICIRHVSRVYASTCLVKFASNFGGVFSDEMKVDLSAWSVLAL